jgi:hypothetical protein
MLRLRAAVPSPTPLPRVSAALRSGVPNIPRVVEDFLPFAPAASLCRHPQERLNPRSTSTVRAFNSASPWMMSGPSQAMGPLMTHHDLGRPAGGLDGLVASEDDQAPVAAGTGTAEFRRPRKDDYGNPSNPGLRPRAPPLHYDGLRLNWYSVASSTASGALPNKSFLTCEMRHSLMPLD